MMLWGFNVSAIKVLVSSIEPLLLTSIRIFTAGIAVLLICRAIGIFRLPTWKEYLIIFFISIFNVVAHHSLLALGLLHTSGVNASLIGGVNPLATMLLSIIFISREITWTRILGFIMGFLGVTVTTITGSDGVSAVSIGDFLVLFSILLQSVSFILISKLRPELDVRLLTGYMLLMGSVAVFLIGLMLEGHPSQLIQLVDWKLGLVFLFSALVSTAFGQMMYNFAIKQIGPAETAIFINFSTFFALVGAVLFLGETITWNHLIGLVLIVFGVLTGTGALESIIRRRYRKTS